MQQDSQLIEMIVRDIQVELDREDYYPIKIITNRGEIECRYYPVTGTEKSVIWICGSRGEWNTPAKDLYPRLCTELMGEAIASLRIRYRYPGILEECILDVLAGLNYLEEEGIKNVAIVGHSFGGAVAIQAAASSVMVRTVVTVATQSYGAAPTSQLAPRCSLLVLHGMDDEILTPQCSQSVYDIAEQPKQLILYPGAHHRLDEVAPEVYQVVRSWLLEKLG